MQVITRGNSRITLYQEDCFQLLEYVKAGEVDVIVTSPPYNLGVQYSQYDDTISREAYLEWISGFGERMEAVLSQDGSFFLNVGSSPKDPLVPFQVLNVMQKYFQLQNVLHWIKSIYIEEESYGERIQVNVGHFKPINSQRFLNDTHEYIFHLTKSGAVPLDRLAIGVPYKDKSNINRWKREKKDGRCRGNCWYVPYETIKSRHRDRPHPASFPKELVKMCIKLHGLERVQLVLDPMMGIGNTALACQELGVDCVGFEIDGDYYSYSLELLEGTF